METNYVPSVVYWKFNIGPYNASSLIRKCTPKKDWDCSVKTTKDMDDLYDWADFMRLLEGPLKSLPLTSKHVAFSLPAPWVNLYHRGDYQDVHDHLNGVEALSYCYFHTLPEGSAKFAIFNEQYSQHNHGRLYTGIDLKTLGIEEWIYPDVKQHDLLIFPAFVKHKVTVHNTDAPRVTISGNVRIIPT